MRILALSELDAVSGAGCRCAPKPPKCRGSGKSSSKTSSKTSSKNSKCKKSKKNRC